MGMVMETVMSIFIGFSRWNVEFSLFRIVLERDMERFGRISIPGC